MYMITSTREECALKQKVRENRVSPTVLYVPRIPGTIIILFLPGIHRTKMDVDDEDADLQRALELSRATAQPSIPVPPLLPSPGLGSINMNVIGSFPVKFRCYAGAAAGRSDLDATGRVLLPTSCLAAFGAFFKGDMPNTMLLCLTAGPSFCVVGIAEFVADDIVATMLAKAGGTAIREQPLPRLFDRGPIAAIFVPRWVRSSLLLDPCCPECKVQIVSLPKACYLKLQPQCDEFTTALTAHGEGDVRSTLTELINRFPAISRGASISLQLDSRRFSVGVVAVRGLPNVRCGESPMDVQHSGGDATSPHTTAGKKNLPSRGLDAAAVCLVDADVEVEFTQSVAMEAAAAEAHAAEAAAAEAAKRAKAVDDERAAAAAGHTEQRQQEARAAAALATATRLQRSASLLASLEARESLMSAVAAEKCAMIDVVVRCPDGSRYARQLRADSPLVAVFWIVDTQATASAIPDGRDFALATSYPRRRFLRPSEPQEPSQQQEQFFSGSITLLSSGLAATAQLTFFVDLL